MKDDNGVRRLAGTREPANIPFPPFDTRVLDFLDALSQAIRMLPREEAGEELRALGFWLRRTHLLDLKERYAGGSSPEPENRLGLGLSFHIAPANVPLMFAYSLAIGLMAGNCCLVRVSGRRTKEGERLCSLLDHLLSEDGFACMRERISIVSYDRENMDTTQAFSQKCDVRIVWGGDETVRAVRNAVLKPSAAEVVFPDRTAISVLGAEAVAALGEEELRQLAAYFYNDTYGMDQNACSCPKAVFWQEADTEAGKRASERFWNAVAAASERYALSEIKVSQKYGALWELMSSGAKVKRVQRWKNGLYVVASEDIPGEALGSWMQFGSFLEYHMKSGEEWTEAVSEKTQTLTFFGVDGAALRETVLSRGLRGIFRIVPVGQALWMDVVWDGKDLIRLLSRFVS